MQKQIDSLPEPSVNINQLTNIEAAPVPVAPAPVINAAPVDIEVTRGMFDDLRAMVVANQEK